MTTTWRNIILDPIELAEIYEWIDSVPLSRPKGVIEKDFADGVLVAEIVKHYFPQIVDLRNYTQAKNLQERMSNWRLLNGKIFSRLGLNVPEHVMTQLCIAKTGVIEVFLYNLRESVRAMMLYRDHDPRMAPMRGLYSTADPYLLKYHMLSPTDPLYKYNNLDKYYGRRSLLIDNTRALLGKQALQQQLLQQTGRKTDRKSPGLSLILPPIDRTNGTVSKLELEEKNQEILTKEEEIQTLKAKLKRVEHLVTLKDTRISELQLQLEKLNHKGNTGTTKTN